MKHNRYEFDDLHEKAKQQSAALRAAIKDIERDADLGTPITGDNEDQLRQFLLENYDDE